MSDKKISEKGIASAAELLYKGAKMLAHSCPECKMPLFEKDGKIFCPSCGREAVIEGESTSDVPTPVSRTNESPLPDKPAEKGSEPVVVEKVEKAISRVCDLIVESKDVEEVSKLTESLERLTNVLKRLRG